MDDSFATKYSHLRVKETWRASNRLSASSSFDSMGSGDLPPLSPTDPNSDPEEDSIFYNSLFAPAAPQESPTGFAPPSEPPAQDPLNCYANGGGKEFIRQVSILKSNELLSDKNLLTGLF